MLEVGESEVLEVSRRRWRWVSRRCWRSDVLDVSKVATPKRVLAISIKDFFPHSPQHTSRGT